MQFVCCSILLFDKSIKQIHTHLIHNVYSNNIIVKTLIKALKRRRSLFRKDDLNYL